MKLSKQRKKELRQVYQDKVNKEYIEGLKNQPFVSPLEYVEFVIGKHN
jgi:hypothetical protein